MTFSSEATYHSPSSGDIGASGPDPSQDHAAEAPIADFFEDLEPIFQGECGGPTNNRPAMGQIVSDSHS